MPASGDMLCLNCRYSLSSLPRGVCPECGKAFDPTDPATFLVPGNLMLRPACSRAPDWGHFSLAIVGSCLFLAAYWGLAANLLLIIVASGIWLGVGVPAVARAVLRAVPQSRHRLRVPRAKFWRRASMVFSIALATYLLIWFEVPLKLRYRLHASALESIADKLAAYEGNVHDVEGRYRQLPSLVAIYKIPNGEMIQIRAAVDRSYFWNDDDGWDKDWFDNARFSGLARLRVPPVGNEYEHAWGRWYLIR